ncbi:global transcription factor C [Actinidia rufa]|uniref:FACT complex subunit n=1 Tax=Actinidia rufa TaxID=165716 RepID=A0A7J0ESW0_9ERIC|nr:global transcription factor C [Actinidia rufa]
MADHQNGNARTTNGKASGSGGASACYTINLDSFGKRLKMLYSHWNEYNDDLWGTSEALAIATPPPSEDLRYLKSSALNVWLVGYEFPDTIMVFMKTQIHFLCSQKKASLLEVVKKSAKEAVGAEVVMHVKAKNDDGTALMESIFGAVRAQSKLDGHDTPLSDITNGFSDLFGVKDGGEITNVKKAAYLTSSVMKHFVVPTLEKVIDEEKKISHSSLMDDTEKAILEPARIKVKLKAENIDICYPPIFQSGGGFDLKPSASSNDENLYYDSTSVIICAIGSRYNSYCSNVARTFLIDANAMQSKAYEVLLKAHDAAISALKPGNKAGDAYQAALSVVEKDAPEFCRKLDENLQTQTNNPKTQKFAVLLADTVIVGENHAEVLTSITSKAVKDVAYSFNDDDEEEQPKVKAVCQKVPTHYHQRLPSGQSTRTQRRNSEGNTRQNLPGRRTKKQLGGLQVAVLDWQIIVVLVCLASRTQIVLAISELSLMYLVPPFNPHDANSSKFQSSIYVKEVSFRSKDPRHITEVVQLIKSLRRQVASRESEKAERATLVTQEKLQVAGTKFKPIRLTDLWIRPVFGGRGRKLTGTLEAHTNGFRYSTSRHDERVDVMFGNVKHAFFQPAEREMITLVHFHLHNHIMVGNKKTKDVQFYVEVMDVVQTLGGAKRSAYDPDEIEEEQRERDRKNKINMDFQNFVNRVNDLWGQPQFKALDLEFDQPFRDLGFHGVPHKASAFIVPTSSCLVELIETPFVVITLNEIEIVNLERVGLGQKNFDMTIVFKDFKRDVFRIDSIPSTSLDGIKEWLDTTDLKYYESSLNLNWRPILKTITDDPEKFIEDGGWEFLNMEASDSDSDHSQESDQGYEPSDVQSDTGSEEEEEDSASLVESDDDDEEVSEEDLEEDEGKTWEELEREASRADKEKGAESDSEDERKRRKIKAFGKARVPDKRNPSGSLPKRPKFR